MFRSLCVAASLAALSALPTAAFAVPVQPCFPTPGGVCFFPINPPPPNNPPPARNTTQTSTLTVTGAVTNNCTGFITGTFTGGQAPNFDPTSNMNASNSVDENIKCTAGAQPTLTISGGANGTTGNDDRKYTGASHGFLLEYTINDNSPNAPSPGMAYPSNTAVSLGTSQGPATPIDINVTQTIPATPQNNMAPADSYSDTITLSLNF